MKHNIFLPLVLCSLQVSQAQVGGSHPQEPVSLRPNYQFDMYQKTGSGGIAEVKTNVSDGADGSQFYLGGWKEGEVALTDQEVFNKGFVFAYDKVRQELFIRQKDSALVLLGNKDQIKSFSLKDGKREYNFLNSSFFSVPGSQFFYEVLVYDSSKITLLKSVQTRLVTSNGNDMMRQREGKMNDEFVDKISYFVASENSLPISIQMKTKSVSKVLTELKVNPDAYLNEHPGSVNEEYLINMIATLNK